MNCPRGMNPRHYEITLTDRAWNWFKEHSGVEMNRSQLRALIQVKLNNKLTTGLKLDKTGAGRIGIAPNVWAAVRLGNTGWMVAEFIVSE